MRLRVVESFPVMPSTPPKPRPDVHHGQLCWVTRWYGDPCPHTGKRPQYSQRWYVAEEKRAMALYAAWLARWQQDPAMQDPRRAEAHITVADLAEAYLRHAERTYRKAGRITSYVYKVRAALQSLIDHYGDYKADTMTMAVLAQWRDALAESGELGRRYINDMLQVVRAAYRWAAERGSVSDQTYQAVASVERLRKGRSKATERKRVKPVDWSVVEQTLPHLSPVVQAMVKVLWHTGMRPEEVCEMRTGDLDQSGDVWLYRPPSHKLDHLEGEAGGEKIIAIGPQAQVELQPYVRPDLQAPLFQPVEGSRKRQKNYGRAYTSSSLRQAIHRGCDRAWPPPEHLQRRKIEASGRKRQKIESEKAWRDRLGAKAWTELRAWQIVHRWSPNQLRHAKATLLRKRYGIEAARVALGHQHISTSEFYAEASLGTAVKIAKEAG